MTHPILTFILLALPSFVVAWLVDEKVPKLSLLQGFLLYTLLISEIVLIENAVFYLLHFSL